MKKVRVKKIRMLTDGESCKLIAMGTVLRSKFMASETFSQRFMLGSIPTQIPVSPCVSLTSVAGASTGGNNSGYRGGSEDDKEQPKFMFLMVGVRWSRVVG